MHAFYRKLLVICTLLTTLVCESAFSRDAKPRCLFVSSYHTGYAWSDGLTRGLVQTLEPHCDIRQIDLDTKRRKAPEQIEAAAAEAYRTIEEWQPDVVITADDNAMRYLVVPYLKDSSTPVVFSGINWTVREYQLPFSNTTGMIEIAPIGELFERVDREIGTIRRAIYLGADTLTEKKNLKRFEAAARMRGLQLTGILVDNQADWLATYLNASATHDLLILGSNAGIDDWDARQVLTGIRQDKPGFSVTNHDWMMPYAILGLTKVPEEQGEWAGQLTLSILNGTPPRAIPIVTNRRWDIWINQELLTRSGVRLSAGTVRKAKSYIADE